MMLGSKHFIIIFSQDNSIVLAYATTDCWKTRPTTNEMLVDSVCVQNAVSKLLHAISMCRDLFVDNAQRISYFLVRCTLQFGFSTIIRQSSTTSIAVWQ